MGLETDVQLKDTLRWHKKVRDIKKIKLRKINFLQKKKIIGGAIAVVALAKWNICNLKDQNSKSFKNTIPAICLDFGTNESKQLLFQLFVNGSVEIEFNAGENIVNQVNKGGLIFAQVFLISFFSINIVLIVTRFYTFLKNEENFFTFSKFMFIVLFICKKKKNFFF